MYLHFQYICSSFSNLFPSFSTMIFTRFANSFLVSSWVFSSFILETFSEGEKSLPAYDAKNGFSPDYQSTIITFSVLRDVSAWTPPRRGLWWALTTSATFWPSSLSLTTEGDRPLQSQNTSPVAWPWSPSDQPFSHYLTFSPTGKISLKSTYLQSHW